MKIWNQWRKSGGIWGISLLSLFYSEDFAGFVIAGFCFEWPRSRHWQTLASRHKGKDLSTVSCSTGTYDCHWEPSPLYAIAAPPVEIEEPQPLFLHNERAPQLIRLEWCSRCRLLRIPE